MGVRIIEGNHDGDSNGYAVLYCSVSMWAFGPVFKDVEEAESFLDFLGEGRENDPRSMSDAELTLKYHDFLATREEEEKTEV